MLPFYVNKNQTPSTNKFHNIHSAEYFLHSQDDNLRPPLVEVSDPKKILISDIMIPMPIISLLVQDILIILLLQNSKTAKLVIKARLSDV